MSLRVYPIRMTRKQWHIGLYTIHDCTQGCNYSLVKHKKKHTYKFKLKVINDANDHQNCSRNKNIEHTIVSINNFDVHNPMGIFGKLHLADNIVIPHNEFTMILRFPFCTKLKITVNEPLGDGFTLKEVLYAIKLSYQDIYETEEQTATQNTYVLFKECLECNHIKIKQSLQNNSIVDDKNNNFTCSICKDNVAPISEDVTNQSTSIIKLDNCRHIFHEYCMHKWIDANGKTCPLCRNTLFECSQCDGSGYKTIYHEGVVPPIEYRGITPRLHTDGIYGIYDYYLEDLYVNGLKYNSEKRELFVNIQT